MANGSVVMDGMARDRFDSSLTPTQDLVYGSLMAVTGTVSVVANLAVLLMFHRRKGRLDVVEYLLYNLIVSTLIMMMVTCPLNAASAFSHRWIFDDFGCALHGALSFFCGMVNISALVSIGAIRYIKTCWAFTASVNDPRTPARLLVAVYLWAAFWSCCPLLGWGRYGVEQHGLCCSLDWEPTTTGDRAYIALSAAVALFLPALALIFFYWRIVVMVRHTQRQAGRANARKTNTERQLHVVSVVLVMGFLLAWVPYAAVSLLSAFAGHHVTGPEAVAIVTLLTKNSGWYNPAIYILFSRQYRTDFRAALQLPGWCRPAARGRQQQQQQTGQQTGQQAGQRQQTALTADSCHAGPLTASPASTHSVVSISRNASANVSISVSASVPRVCATPGGPRETSL